MKQLMIAVPECRCMPWCSDWDTPRKQCWRNCSRSQMSAHHQLNVRAFWGMGLLAHVSRKLPPCSQTHNWIQLQLQEAPGLVWWKNGSIRELLREKHEAHDAKHQNSNSSNLHDNERTLNTVMGWTRQVQMPTAFSTIGWLPKLWLEFLNPTLFPFPVYAGIRQR